LSKKPTFLEDFKRLSHPMWLNEDPSMAGAVQNPTGQADLTPLKNRAREAVEALNAAMAAADAGKLDDTMEAIRRAKAAIDAALGGQNASAIPTGGTYASGGISGSSALGR
jgi:hypothetical protein